MRLLSNNLLLFTESSKLRHFRFLTLRKENPQAKIGFVPTMGNLHLGHLTLLEDALNENDIVFFSIFVNPKQFGPLEDFAKYPRTLEKDVDQISAILSKFPTKKVIIFAPSTIEEIFPPNYETSIKVSKLSTLLCGKTRPDHFEGVTTVVYRLFLLIKPHTAYFGQKDFQQQLIIRQMVKDLLLPVKIKTCPIIRDSDGLALSSRNQYLSKSDRKKALLLNISLKKIETLMREDSATAASIQILIDKILNEDSFPNVKWDYLTFLEATTLTPVLNLKSHPKIVILGALKIEQTRLIDNIVVSIKRK